ncbi:MAG: RbsD or FucU transport [Chloroflexi bacterium]|nr:RbsD or FucU transport [Chloroflexota bacterium]
MLKYRLLHPGLLSVLAQAGHGSRVLLADANYPVATGAPPHTRRIYLNLAPGRLSVAEVLKVLLDAIPVEAAYAMRMDSGAEPPIVAEFRKWLPPEAEIQLLPRFDFYDAVNTPQTAVVIATGEDQLYANLLLTIGVVRPGGA